MSSITKQQAKRDRALLALFEEQKAAKRGKKVSGKTTVKHTKAEQMSRAVKTSRRKVENRAVNYEGTVPGHRCLIRKNRTMFIADHDWAADRTPASELIRQVVEDGSPLVGNWAISAKAVAKVLEIDEAKATPITRESQGGKAAKGKAKKGKKAKKAKKDKAVLNDAETDLVDLPVVDEPEWGSAEWIATTHPREKDTPRNAKGQPTPRKEWAVRIALEETGQYDRNEVDVKVQEAYDAGLIEI